MNIDRRRLLLAAGSIAALESVSSSGLLAVEAPKDLYRTTNPQTLLAAARTLITEDTIATLITLDANSQPRARSILVSPPDDDLTLWMATRPGSRKLDQLRANPIATLHFAEDSKAAYLSLMGTAHIHTDPATIQAKNPYKGAGLTHFFPHFPADFVLLGFKPQWLEIATATLPSNPVTWQPQGLAL
jgi:general stress protein 26